MSTDSIYSSSQTVYPPASTPQKVWTVVAVALSLLNLGYLYVALPIVLAGGPLTHLGYNLVLLLIFGCGALAVAGSLYLFIAGWRIDRAAHRGRRRQSFPQLLLDLPPLVERFGFGLLVINIVMFALAWQSLIDFGLYFH